jgi:hypothetical protein
MQLYKQTYITIRAKINIHCRFLTGGNAQQRAFIAIRTEDNSIGPLQCHKMHRIAEHVSRLCGTVGQRPSGRRGVANKWLFHHMIVTVILKRPIVSHECSFDANDMCMAQICITIHYMGGAGLAHQ